MWCGHALLSASRSNLVPGTRTPPRRRARARAALRGFTSLGHENSAPDRRPPTNRILRRYIPGVRTCAPARPPTHPLCALVSLAAAFSRFRRRRRPETRTRRALLRITLFIYYTTRSKEPQQLLARHLDGARLASRFATALSKLLHRVVAARRRSFTDQSCIAIWMSDWRRISDTANCPVSDDKLI